MALNQLPDFSYKGEVPFAAIVAAYQQKAQQEQQMRMEGEQLRQQKIQQVAETFKAGAGLVNAITEHNKQAQIKDARSALASLLQRGSEPYPTGAQSVGMVGGAPVPVAQMGTYAMSPEYKNELASIVTKAFPEQAGKEVAKAAFAQLNPENKQGVMQQAALELTNGKTVAATFDNGTYYYANTKTPIPADQIAGRAYGLTPVQNADGSVSLVSRTSGTERNVHSTAVPAVPASKYGTVKSLAPLEKTERGDVLERITAAKNDEVIKKGRESLKTLDSVIMNLDRNNKVATDRLGGLVQKLVALDSGNLAAWEQRDPGSRDVISRIGQYYTMATKGELSKKNKAELKKLLDNAQENLVKNMNDTADSHADTITSLYPELNKDFVKSSFGLGVYNKRVKTQDQIDAEVQDVFKSILNGNQ